MKKYLLLIWLISVFMISACAQQPAQPAPQTPVVQEVFIEDESSIEADQQEVKGDSVVVKSLFLDKPGYVVIHKVVDGKPGAVIGNSELLKGEVSNVKVDISDYGNENELIAMLHYDNGDRTYNFPGDDNPTTVDGRIVLTKFSLIKPDVGAEAPETAQEMPVPTVKEFTIEGDDKVLEPSTIEVNRGDKVKIIFKVRKEGTYFGGLDFRSEEWGDTGKVKPGDSTTVEFTADKTFEFKSYWPASNRLKAIGTVVVK